MRFRFHAKQTKTSVHSPVTFFRVYVVACGNGVGGWASSYPRQRFRKADGGRQPPPAGTSPAWSGSPRT